MIIVWLIFGVVAVFSFYGVKTIMREKRVTRVEKKKAQKEARSSYDFPFENYLRKGPPLKRPSTTDELVYKYLAGEVGVEALKDMDTTELVNDARLDQVLAKLEEEMRAKTRDPGFSEWG
jgi:hypothetical protein